MSDNKTPKATKGTAAKSFARPQVKDAPRQIGEGPTGVSAQQSLKGRRFKGLNRK